MTRTLMAILLTTLLGGVAPCAQTPTPPPATQAGSVLDINTATAAQLETLPGIGKATAGRIIEYREKNGGFKKIEELMNVRGIGEKSFLTLKPLITVAASRTDRAPQE